MCVYADERQILYFTFCFEGVAGACWVQVKLLFVVFVRQGWVLQGIPKTRLQALSLQQAGILPKHLGKNISVLCLHAPCSPLLMYDCSDAGGP